MEARTLCPITGGYASQETSVSTEFIIDGYLTNYDIDVKHIFQGKKEISIYRSEDTDLRFFGPDHLAGDGPFYEKLQDYPWYYMEWKWEHEVIKDFLKPGMRVLELGCGQGAFLKGIADKCPDSVGLELNDAAVLYGKAHGIDIQGDPIQVHAQNNAAQYDVVCSFQVMEHVTDLRGIIEASLQCLKPGGKLIISVPNNESFIRRSKESLLNMPPHHMNLWDTTSLTKISNFFDMQVEGFLYEPLQAYHYQVVLNGWIMENIKPKLFAKIANKLCKLTKAYKLASFFRKKVKGHSIISIYTKD